MTESPTASLLHRLRIETVVAELKRAGARDILDLGCGTGDLVHALMAAGGFGRIVGVDISSADVEQARNRLAQRAGGAGSKVEFLCMSLTEMPERYRGFDAAVLLEVIEHVDASRLQSVERSVFGRLRPAMAIVTTPNSEYNPLLGVPAGRFRHPDHRFEWDRARFAAWAGGVARRNAYEVRLADIPAGSAGKGGPSQMAVFERVLANGPV